MCLTSHICQYYCNKVHYYTHPFETFLEHSGLSLCQSFAIERNRTVCPYEGKPFEQTFVNNNMNWCQNIMSTECHHWCLTVHFEILGFSFQNKVVGLVGHHYRHYCKRMLSILKIHQLVLLKSLKLSKFSDLERRRKNRDKAKRFQWSLFTEYDGGACGERCILGLVVVLGSRKRQLLPVELSVPAVRLTPHQKHS